MKLFLSEHEWKYYEELKRACSESQEEWNVDLSRMIEHFSNRKQDLDTLVDVYLKSGTFDQALTKVLEEKTPHLLLEYHDKLARRYPKEYFDAYKKAIVVFANRKMGRKHYKDIVTYLKKMRTIREFEKEFNKFLESLRKTYAGKPALLDEMNSL